MQSFQLHIGANLPLPTRENQVQLGAPVDPHPLKPAVARKNYFEGLPLRAWAERLGERVMPTVELVQEEHRRAKAAAAKLTASAPALAVPSVPAFLPISKW